MFETLRSAVRSWLSNWPASEFPTIFGGGRSTAAGVNVSEYTAMNYSAWWAAVATVAADTASLPLILYKRLPNGGKERFVGSKLYELLHDAPNPEMTAMVFREALQGHVMTWGNAYAEIERSRLDNRPMALWPLTPERVTPFRDERTNALLYRVTNSRGPQTILPPDRILHVPGLGFDGITGYSVIQHARQAVGLGLATEAFGGEFFGNGTTFGGILTTEKPLTTQVKQEIRESIDAIHTGVERAHRFGIFGHGLKFEKTGIPPNDAQFLETRKFQVTEIARWFQIPPHKLGDLERATFSNIEQQDIEYYRSCLRRWLVRWEQELNRKLISPLERRQQFFKHNAEGVLRGDSAARASFYSSMFQVGAYSINMILESEDLNPIGPEGDVHFVQHQVQPADLAMKGPALPTVTDVTPQPKALPAADEDDEDEERTALRSLLSEIAANTAALQTSMAAEREAMSQAQREQHQQVVARLEEERAELGRAFDAYKEERRQETARLEADRQAAEEAARAEEIRRAEAEAVAAAAADERERIRQDADRRTAEERAAREAAAVESHAAREAAEAVARDEQARRAAAESAAADAVAERDRIRDDGERRAADDRAARDAADAALADAIQRVIETEERASRLVDETRTLHTAETEAMRVAREQAEREVAEARRQAVDAQERVVTLESAMVARTTAELDRLTRVVTAHRALIVDVVKRVLVPEVDRARRKQATPDTLRKWADAFYVTHPDVCAEALYPAVLTHLAWKGSDENPREAARALALAHCEESKRQIDAVIDGSTVEAFHSDLERLLQRWEHERPDAVADKVLNDELEHIRSYH